MRVYNGMIHLHAYVPSVVSVRNPFSELDGALRLATVDGGNSDMVYSCAVVGDSIEYAYIRSSGLPCAVPAGNTYIPTMKDGDGQGKRRCLKLLILRAAM